MTRPLAQRLRIYQRERFPLAAYTVLIAAATFAAISFSAHARQTPRAEEIVSSALAQLGRVELPDWPVWIVGGLTLLVLFFGLRVLDEHKDAGIDRRYRPELPVPRGLVSLRELRGTGIAALLLVLVANGILAPVLLVAILPVLIWAALMTAEFFVPDWLKARPTLYLLSHMVIMPLILGYATALDWLLAGAPPPGGLVPFLLAAFLAGVGIEVGRKIRPPGEEREGVETYTRSWGPRAAPAIWILALAGSWAAAWWAAGHTGAGTVTAIGLGILLGVAAFPTLAFMRSPSPGARKGIDLASGIWALAMYLVLGAGPYLSRWLGEGLSAAAVTGAGLARSVASLGLG